MKKEIEDQLSNVTAQLSALSNGKHEYEIKAASNGVLHMLSDYRKERQRMVFTYQRYYFRIFIGGLLVVVLCMTEHWIWHKMKIQIDDKIFILLTVAIIFILRNIIFKYTERLVIRCGKILLCEDNSLEIVLCNKIYKVRRIHEADFYTFKIYGVSIGAIHIKFEDEKLNTKNLQIFSEDLYNKKFVDTSLYEVMHLNIPNMNDISES